MSVLVVGSVALDSVTTPFGEAEEVLGGSANYFSAAVSLFEPVQVVGVVGPDYPLDKLAFLEERGVDLSGIVEKPGESFRWEGVYDFDLANPETRDTRLGVFADFQPRLPDEFRDARWVFLANIDPELQLDVLEQVRSPHLVACDTMNYWIESKKDALVELLDHVDALLLNDGEIRELSGEYSLVRAARWVHERGPDLVVVKKGEHGAVLFGPEMIFFAPGFPLEEAFDPTGAGDAFAGGFLGHLARSGSMDPADLRRAMIYGSAMGSFAVEQFSIDRFVDLNPADVHARVAAIREMTAFEHVAAGAPA